MKKIIFFIAALAFWLTTTSCIRKAQDVYGPKVTKSYKVANFNAISLSVDAEVQFIQDATTSIQITGPENKLANLQIATNGSVKHQAKQELSLLRSLDWYGQRGGILIENLYPFSPATTCNSDRLWRLLL